MEDSFIIAAENANPDHVKQVVDFVCEQGGVTFVELQGLLSEVMEVRGDVAMTLPGYENIILWASMSKEFCEVVAEALRSHQIETRPTQLLVYQVDGGALHMPIAKSARQYKEPHWLPVTFSKYVDESAKRRKRGK